MVKKLKLAKIQKIREKILEINANKNKILIQTNWMWIWIWIIWKYNVNKVLDPIFCHFFFITITTHSNKM